MSLSLAALQGPVSVVSSNYKNNHQDLQPSEVDTGEGETIIEMMAIH